MAKKAKVRRTKSYNQMSSQADRLMDELARKSRLFREIMDDNSVSKSYNDRLRDVADYYAGYGDLHQYNPEILDRNYKEDREIENRIKRVSDAYAKYDERLGSRIKKKADFDKQFSTASYMGNVAG